MKAPFRALACSLFLAVALARHPAPAQNMPSNLIQNPDFTTVTYSGTKPLTTIFGEFGTGPGSLLALANWSTTGYNFVYAPNTADTGTGSGANTGKPNEAPGQYNASNGYGSTYMWGSNNGGTATLPATDPAGGNFIAADGAYETGAITQMVTGLTVGNVYALNFYWAAAQQQSFTSATTEKWNVSLGRQTSATPVVNLASKGFSGWMSQTFIYTATSTSELLSFLAAGTPSGQPPFLLLGGVDLEPIPEPSAWMMVAGFGTVGTLFEVVRRRRRAAGRADGPAQ